MCPKIIETIPEVNVSGLSTGYFFDGIDRIYWIIAVRVNF